MNAFSQTDFAEARVAAAPPPVAAPDLSTRAMLAGLHVTQWTARKIDRRVTRDVHDRAGAADDAGRYNKLLLAKEALAEVTSLVSEARAFHYARTQPWLDEGGRVLPAALFTDYAGKLRDIRSRFEVAVDRFCAGYDLYVGEAARRLGDMFDPADYPPVSTIRRRFDFRSVVLPLPVAADFRVGLSTVQAEQVRAQIEETTRDALQRATKDAWERIADVTGRMVDRLNAYKPAVAPGDKAEGIFRDSLVSNVRDLVEVLPAFNLVDDPRLDAITARLRDTCAAHEPEALRSDETLRQDTATAAAAILAEVQGYL